MKINKMRVLGISGKIGTGKDYIVSNIIIPLLEQKYNMTPIVLAFADQLKYEMIVERGFSFESVWEKKTHESRIAMQQAGQEKRSRFGSSVYIRYLFEQMRILHKRHPKYVFIIVDVRFKNEMDFIKKELNGMVVRLIAPKRNMIKLKQEHQTNEQIEKVSTNISEVDLDDYPFESYELIKNDVEDELQVKQSIEHLLQVWSCY